MGICQTKAVNRISQVHYISQNTEKVIELFPLASEYVLEHYFAAFDGDERALEDYLLRYTHNREVRFPSNQQMIYDTEERLERRLKSMIVNSNL